jgi:replication factor A1
MEQEQIAPVIQEIKEALPDVEEDKLKAELDRYLRYGILPQEAKKAIIRKFGGTPASFSPLGEKKLKELKGGEMNIDVTVRCLSSKERIQKTANGDKTLVTGLVADSTMIRRFVSWEGHLLEKGKNYLIKGASAKTYRGEVEINLGLYSQVEDAPEGTLDDLDVSKLPRFGNLQELKLKDVRPGMGNIQVTVKVIDVEKRAIETDKGRKNIIDGMLADETKRVRFTSWSEFGFEIGDVVTIKGAYVKDWRGIPQINFDERAEIEKESGTDFDVMKTPRLLAEDLLNAGATDVEIAGTIIEVRDGSGLIFRCPECNRALMNGTCNLHGQQEGIADLRTKVVLDDGTGALFAVLNTEITEQVLGRNVTDCVQKYCDDEERIVDELNSKLLGRDYVMRGNVIRDDFGPTVLPSQVVEEEVNDPEEAQAMLDIMEVL